MLILSFLLSEALLGNMDKINKQADIINHACFLNFIFIAASCFNKVQQQNSVDSTIVAANVL
jgi:hypothetical protein